MTELTYFTVQADYKAVLTDFFDDGTDPDTVPVTATVTFTALVGSGDVIQALDATPRPTGLILAPVTGRVGTDSRLGTRYGQSDIRLVANSAVLDLAGDLYYRADFTNVKFGGIAGQISPVTFQAPTTDSVVNLIEVGNVPGQVSAGITRGPRGFGITGSYLGASADSDAMVAKSGVVGDWTIRTDTFTIWVVTAVPSSVSGNWIELQYPSGATAFARLLLGASDSGEAMAILGEDAIADAVALVAPDLVEAAVTADIAGRSLVETTNPQLLQPIIGGSNAPLWAVVDSNNRQAIAILVDGSTRIYKFDPASVTDGSVETVKLSSAVQAQLVQSGVGSMLVTLSPESGYLWAVVDSAGRIGLALKTDGTVYGKIPVADASVTAAKLESTLAARIPPTSWVSAPVPEVTGSTPSRKLWLLSQATGQRALITDVNDPREAVEDAGAILFTDNNGRRAYTGGLIVPAYPDRSVIAAWGDSLTEGWPTTDFTSPATQSWPGVLDPLITASVTNLGKTGQTADEIAIRQGGYVLDVAVSGGSIPASGAITVTTTQGFCFKFSLTWSQVGTLSGVPGTMSRLSSDPVGTLTFTRTTSGSAVALSGTAKFTSSAAVANESYPVVLFAGRNDIGYSPAGIAIADPVTRVLAAFDAMVARLRAYHKEFIVIGTTTATTETSGSAGYVAVKAINDTLSTKYGNRFYDLRHYLVTQAIYDLGITPTSPDLANIAADTLPPSIMAASGTDTVHYSVATAAKVAAVIKTKLDQLGWTL